MKSKVVTLLSICISAGIVVASLVLIGSLFLQNTLFSTSYYKNVTESEIFIPLLKQAVANDMKAQSSYVGVPLETLTAGLEDNDLRTSLDSHVDKLLIYLLQKGDFTKSTYPSDLFKKQLEIFIKAEGIKGDYTPTAEQYTLLEDVAKDSSVITQRVVNLVNMDLVKDVSEFKRLHRLAIIMRMLTWPAIASLIVLLGLLFIIHRKKVTRAVLFAFSAFWIVGASLMVPSIIVMFTGIAKRLSIQTPYLKYAIDTWLTAANQIILYTGIAIFAISTIVLLARILAFRTKPI